MTYAFDYDKKISYKQKVKELENQIQRLIRKLTLRAGDTGVLDIYICL